MALRGQSGVFTRHAGDLFSRDGARTRSKDGRAHECAFCQWPAAAHGKWFECSRLVPSAGYGAAAMRTDSVKETP